MRDYEKKPGKKPEFRSSQGRLREADAKKNRDGADHLTGYRPREQEGSTRPREAGRLENSFGDIAVGTNRRKELMIVVSRRRTQQGPMVREDEKTLRGESARRMERTRGNFSTNSHDKRESAVAYRQSSAKAPQMMLNQFRAMTERNQQQTVKKQMLFLSRETEKQELRELRSRELELRAQGDRDAKAQLRAIERRRQELRQILAEKETQERRMKQVLQKAGEEAAQRAMESWERPFLLAGWDAQADGGEEPLDGDEQGADEAQNEENPDNLGAAADGKGYPL